MSIENVLTLQDIKGLRKIVDDHNVAGASAVYDILQHRYGLQYAGWANGVAQGNTFTGKFALNFLKTTADGLTNTEIDNIRKDMALGYLDALEAILDRKKPDRGLSLQIKFEEMREFHKKAFQDNGCDISNWTLEVPMILVDQYAGGAQSQEMVWNKLAKTDGEGWDSVWQSILLSYFVITCSFGNCYVNHDGSYLSMDEIINLLEDNNLKKYADTLKTGEPSVLDINDAIKALYEQNLITKKPIDQTDKELAGEWVYLSYNVFVLDMVPDIAISVVAKVIDELIPIASLLDEKPLTSVPEIEVLDLYPTNMYHFISYNNSIANSDQYSNEERAQHGLRELAYIQGLKDLNSVVVVNSPSGISKLEDVGQEWIWARTLFLQELRHRDSDQSIQEYDEVQAFLQTCRTDLGLDPDACIEYIDSEHGFDFSVNSKSEVEHTVAFFDAERFEGSQGKDWIFGGDGDNQLIGNDGDDYIAVGYGADNLQGGNGDDVLVGGVHKQLDDFERDLLQGGDGYDTYYVGANDIIMDSDGEGHIIWVMDSANVDLSSLEFKRIAANAPVWEAENDGQTFRAVFVEDENVLVISDGDGWIMIKDFKQGDLDIKLLDTVKQEPGYTMWRGDIEPETNDKGKYQVNWENRSERNEDGSLNHGKYNAGFQDVIYGAHNENNKIYGLGGNDAISGRDSNDFLLGGSGIDAIVGAGGSDIIYGGSEDDFIFSNAVSIIPQRQGRDDSMQAYINGMKDIDKMIVENPTWFVYLSTNGPLHFLKMFNNNLVNIDQLGDVIFAGSGEDRVIGSDVADIIFGDLTDDESHKKVSGDKDTIMGDSGSDLIVGGEGADVLDGDSGFYNSSNDGDDIIFAGVGDDI